MNIPRATIDSSFLLYPSKTAMKWCLPPFSRSPTTTTSSSSYCHDVRSVMLMRHRNGSGCPKVVFLGEKRGGDVRLDKALICPVTMDTGRRSKRFFSPATPHRSDLYFFSDCCAVRSFIFQIYRFFLWCYLSPYRTKRSDSNARGKYF